MTGSKRKAYKDNPFQKELVGILCECLEILDDGADENPPERKGLIERLNKMIIFIENSQCKAANKTNRVLKLEEQLTLIFKALRHDFRNFTSDHLLDGIIAAEKIHLSDNPLKRFKKEFKKKYKRQEFLRQMTRLSIVGFTMIQHGKILESEHQKVKEMEENESLQDPARGINPGSEQGEDIHRQGESPKES